LGRRGNRKAAKRQNPRQQLYQIALGTALLLHPAMSFVRNDMARDNPAVTPALLSGTLAAPRLLPVIGEEQ
jgi:hypothetical protein